MPGHHPRDLTDSELRTVARWVARTMLEVERGHRPAKALRPFLAPHLYHGVRIATPSPGRPPVSSSDVGNATFTRLSRTAGYAAVAIRDHHGGWDGLTMVLRRMQPARWQFIDITRASRQPAAPPKRARAGSTPPAPRGHSTQGGTAP